MANAPTTQPGIDAVAPAKPYVVLARKYRPRTFDDLIGQGALVQTLRNAFASGRIAQAYMLTGVRGTGKTTTARILARAFNYERDGADGGPKVDRPTIDMPVLGRHCADIMESRHPDVIEMDAASNTGVDDVREIIESARYKPLVARIKVFIIDEVHMLSKNAFNALLKTLEEPPAHVKFLFATTEVAKVPVTVLSRCQRFDLKRIPAETLAAHFAKVAAAEGVAVEPEALDVIARAAEGSARDGLSILDQAIAHGEATVTAAEVRDMLGLADRGRVRRLFVALIESDGAATLAQLDEAYNLGLDPAALMRGLMETVHSVTRVKAGAPLDVMQSTEERDAADQWAGKLGWAVLHRLWQLLLKGLQDVTIAPDPHEAAAMVLLRLVHAADLPDPAALLTRLASGEGTAVTSPSGRSAAPQPAPSAEFAPATFSAFVDQLENAGKMRLGIQLRDHAGLVDFAPGALTLRQLRPLGNDFTRELAAAATEVTGLVWTITLADTGGEPSLQEQAKTAAERDRVAVLKEPIMAALLAAFPDATFESIISKEPTHAQSR